MHSFACGDTQEYISRSIGEEVATREAAECLD